MNDNRGQVCGHCGSVNHDPLADYRNENGTLACSYQCYERQQVIWLTPRCDICDGLGAAIEQRVVGDVMVDEAGHRWISAVRGRNPELHARMLRGFLSKLRAAEPDHPWVR